MPKATTTYPSSVVNGRRRSNAGWHPKGKRAYRNAERTIIKCLTSYRDPRLYHVVFSGGTNKQHRAMLTALCLRLTRKGYRHEWFAGREKSLDKGEHLHIFILVDTHGKQVHSVLNTFDDCWLTMTCHQRQLNKPYVNGPQDSEIHGNNRYAQLPYLGPGNRATEQGIARLVDALDWLSYIYKARDKHEGEWEKEGQVFPASRPSRDRSMVTTPIDCTPCIDPVIKLRTGDDLLDELIARSQGLYGGLTNPSALRRH